MQKGTILITGASSGIGLASAQLLARYGFHVYGGYLDGEDISLLESTANITPIRLDITKPEQIAAARDSIRAAVGEAGLSGLFNNAGTAFSGPLEHIPMAVLQKQFEINAFGHVAVTQACLPMLRQGRGRIINTVSILGRLALPLGGPYSMTKYALEAFTDSLRREVAHMGIKVIAIEPGAIATSIWQRNEEYGNEIWDEIPDAGQAAYAELHEQFGGSTQEAVDRAIPPSVVAETVLLAFTISKPKTRYLIGSDARLLAFLIWLLPDRVLDWVIPRVLS